MSITDWLPVVFSLLAFQIHFPYKGCSESSLEDGQLVQHLKETLCHLDPVSALPSGISCDHQWTPMDTHTQHTHTTHTHTHTRTHMQCTRTHTHVHTCTHTLECTHTHMNAHTHVHTHVHTHTHTHTHLQTITGIRAHAFSVTSRETSVVHDYEMKLSDQGILAAMGVFYPSTFCLPDRSPLMFGQVPPPPDPEDLFDEGHWLDSQPQQQSRPVPVKCEVAPELLPEATKRLGSVHPGKILGLDQAIHFSIDCACESPVRAFQMICCHMTM